MLFTNPCRKVLKSIVKQYELVNSSYWFSWLRTFYFGQRRTLYRCILSLLIQQSSFTRSWEIETIRVNRINLHVVMCIPCITTPSPFKSRQNGGISFQGGGSRGKGSRSKISFGDVAALVRSHMNGLRTTETMLLALKQ